MWNTELMNKAVDIHNGKCGTGKEQMLMKEYMMFDGMTDEIGNPSYCMSFQSVIDMMTGKKRNPFLYIVCSLISDEFVYVRKENNHEQH